MTLVIEIRSVISEIKHSDNISRIYFSFIPRTRDSGVTRIQTEVGITASTGNTIVPAVQIN